MEAPQKILDRIRKMLALAENNPSIEEAAVAASMASKLMASYNLERADVMIEQLQKDDLIANAAAARKKRIPGWMGRLVVPVARLHDCEARYGQDPNGATRVEYLGQKEDATVAAWVFSFLCEQIEALSKRYRAQQRKLHGGGGHGTNMGDYRDGLCDTVCKMMVDMRREKAEAERQHSSGTALVVRKNELIRQKYKVIYRASRGRSLSDGKAYHDGKRDGAQIKIRQAVTGESRKSIK